MSKTKLVLLFLERVKAFPMHITLGSRDRIQVFYLLSRSDVDSLLFTLYRRFFFPQNVLNPFSEHVPRIQTDIVYFFSFLFSTHNPPTVADIVFPSALFVGVNENVYFRKFVTHVLALSPSADTCICLHTRVTRDDADTLV